jgi:transcriptional regulator with XRE-family HTH domain
MNEKIRIQNLKKLVGDNKSNFIEEAKKSIDKQEWLNYSQEIAFIVLEKLDELKMKQIQLAEKMNVSPQQVSKIVKGNENLTIETIDKLQRALGIKLLVSFEDKKDEQVVDTLTFEKNMQLIEPSNNYLDNYQPAKKIKLEFNKLSNEYSYQDAV